MSHCSGNTNIKLLPIIFPLTQIFRPSMNSFNPLQPKLPNHIIQKLHTLIQRIQQNNLQIRIQNLKGNSRESSPSPHINQPSLRFHYLTNHPAIKKMLTNHIRKFRNSRQIHNLILFHQKLIIKQELFHLLICQAHIQFSKRILNHPKLIFHLSHLFSYSACSVPCRLFCCSIKTKSTEISAGETPEIREAWPIETGRYCSSFCLASIRRLGTSS